jgi:hypothetical protein
MKIVQTPKQLSQDYFNNLITEVLLAVDEINHRSSFAKFSYNVIVVRTFKDLIEFNYVRMI